MKISTSPPTSYGIASKGEYVAFELKHPVNPQQIVSRLNAILPAGASVVSCAEGRLKPVQSFIYKTGRTFSLSLEPDSCVFKDGKALPVADYLEYSDPNTLRIAFKQGRTISPVLLLESYSSDRLNLEEIVKTETIFVQEEPPKGRLD